jgi:hypothetical protein
MVLRQSAEGRGQKLNVLHSIEKRYSVVSLHSPSLLDNDKSDSLRDS